MRVALGVLNKEIERLQVEIDFLESGESNTPKLLRLKADIEELLEAWQVLKEWKRPKDMDFTKFFERDWKQEIVEKEAKYDHCRCVSSDPSDVTLCDKCPDKDKPLHDPTKYTQSDKPEDRVPLVNLASYIEP